MTIPRINVGASRRHLLHEVRLVRTSLEAQVERLDRIECDLSVLSAIQDQNARNLVSFGTGPVAYNVDIHHHSDGSVAFAIDGGKSFSLKARPLGDSLTGVPVREIRGAVLRPFKESRMSVGINFLIASGYTGQTTEALALPPDPVPLERVVGVSLKSYVSLSWTYYFKK